MGKSKKSQRSGRRHSISTSSSSSSSRHSSSSTDRSRGYRRSRSRHCDHYHEKRPDMRMYSVYQPGYGGVPMGGSGYPMQNGMMPCGYNPSMPGYMMPQYGAQGPQMPQIGMMPQQPQMQPPQMNPYPGGYMMNWPQQYQTAQMPVPQMQNAAPPTPVFQFQISPGRNAPCRK